MKPTNADDAIPARRGAGAEKGIALIFTLLLLTFLMALSVGMVIAVSSQSLIGGYYRNYRSAFYAADSGSSIVRQYMVNEIQGLVPSTFTTNNLSPVPATAGTTVQSAVQTAFGSWVSLNSGQAASAWPEQFEVTSGSVTFGLASGTNPVLTYTGANITNYKYTYTYTLTVNGQSRASEQASITDNGQLTLNIGVGSPTSQTVSFAYYGAFINSYNPCLGALVPGTMTGPMYANGAWQFMSGSYIFTDPVTQTNPDFDYWYGGTCIQAAPPANPAQYTGYKYNGQTILPQFQGGYQTGAAALPLPANTYNQEWAVLDGVGTNQAAPTNSNLNTYLNNVSGNPYPSGGTSSGVYLPYQVVNGVPTMEGGGVYVQGNASVQFTTTTGPAPANDAQQVITIVNNGTTTTITLDQTANTTTVASGSTTKTIAGVPAQYQWSNPNGTSNDTGPTKDQKSGGSAATMVYVQGAVTSLSGGGQGQPAIQDNYMMTLTANGNITATGDVLYKTEPVTTTQNENVPGSSPACCSGSPVDTLIPQYQNMNQVLGIFTATGNFDLNTNQSGYNIEVDGSIASISQNGSGGFFNTGHSINTFNNVGGQIQNNIYGAAINTENVYFDRRFTHRQGFAPPWFPSTTVTPGGVSGAVNVSTNVQRVQWLDNSATVN